MSPTWRLSRIAAAVRSPEARHVARVASAALAAFFVYHLLALPQGYWAVFTVVIVMQNSLGATLSASIERVQGTLLGAATGGICACLHPRTPWGLGAAMTLALVVTVYLAARRPALKVAPVTAVIMLITPVGETVGPFLAAGYRILEIGLGSIIAVLATYLIFPAKSGAVVVARIQTVLELLAGMMEAFAEHLDQAPTLGEEETLHLRIRTGLAGVEAAMTDAERERTSRLGEHRLSSALPRTLWRVRNDCVSVSRALGPLPEGVATVLHGPIRQLMAAQAEAMRGCGRALAAGTQVPRDGERRMLAVFEDSMAVVRRSKLTHDLSFETVGRLFGLGFALESLHRNLSDLADRIDEAARAAEV